METSAKSGEGVEDAFVTAAKMLYCDPKFNKAPAPPKKKENKFEDLRYLNNTGMDRNDNGKKTKLKSVKQMETEDGGKQN